MPIVLAGGLGGALGSKGTTFLLSESFSHSMTLTCLNESSTCSLRPSGSYSRPCA